MKHRRNPQHHGDHIVGASMIRCGLAPLELVLALPLLLCVMALIVNFGHAATWKIRTATGARLAAWRHRPLWNADGDPKPANLWPQSATIGVFEASLTPEVDAIWDQQAIRQKWIDGPVFSANGGSIELRERHFNEMAEGLIAGIASVRLRYPFLPSLGQLNLAARHPLISTLWQFYSMGYTGNEMRRAKGWWNVEDNDRWAEEKRQFLQADQALTENPDRELLRPLDRDEDLIRRGYQYDFYAILNPICNDDRDAVRRQLQARGELLDRITGNTDGGVGGVAERMARSYLRMYQDELAALQGGVGVGPRVAVLETWIKQLLKFLALLEQEPPPVRN